MAKLSTIWVDNKTPVSVAVSSVADYLLDETGANVLDELATNIQAEAVTITPKKSTVWT